MFKKFLLFLLCYMCIISAEAYEAYYNRPATNQVLKADFAEFMKNLQEKLRKNWVAPDFMEEGHIRVLFKIDRFGNVISGDILISVDRVKENAELFNCSFEQELRRVIIHGILHLLGVGDKTEEEAVVMRKREEEALKEWENMTMFHKEQ